MKDEVKEATSFGQRVILQLAQGVKKLSRFSPGCFGNHQVYSSITRLDLLSHILKAIPQDELWEISKGSREIYKQYFMHLRSVLQTISRMAAC